MEGWIKSHTMEYFLAFKKGTLTAATVLTSPENTTLGKTARFSTLYAEPGMVIYL